MDKIKLAKIKKSVVELANHQNGNVRRFVALAIRELNIKDEVVGILNRYLVDKQWAVRLEAAKTIRYISGNKDSAISFLTKRLGIDYNELRPTVLGILSGNVSTDKEGDVAKKELIAEVKKAIAVSIAWIDHSIVLDPLLSYLQSDNPSGKIAGAVGLGNIGNDKALELLEENAKKASEDIKVRKACVVSLGKIKNVSSFETLKVVAEDKNDELRKEAIIAINHIKPDGADEIFLKTIKDESPSVREVSCIALGNLKNKDYLGNILELLNDLQPNVRKAAASVLSSWREKDAIPFLLERIEDGNEYVQNEVALAYMKIARNTGKIDVEALLLALGEDETEEEENVKEEE